jgi:hypothetical protein
MNIEDLTSEQVETMINNYRKKSVSIGGKFPLSALLLEQKRRVPSKFGGADVVKGIIDLAHQSTSGLVTYGELYKHLSGGLAWKGNATQSEMSRALDQGIHYCILNSLPILTVIVVRLNGKLAPDAIQNIYNECKDLGLNVGSEPDKFVTQQLELCRKFIAAQISTSLFILDNN